MVTYNVVTFFCDLTFGNPGSPQLMLGSLILAAYLKRSSDAENTQTLRQKIPEKETNCCLTFLKYLFGVPLLIVFFILFLTVNLFDGTSSVD